MNVVSQIALSHEQEHAVELCTDMDEPIASVTGGAGTGKTVVLGHVYRELKSKSNSIVLAAPTGRAAKRITELTGINAITIHRLLEFPMPDEEGTPGEPRRHSQRRLEQDIVIIDEASMLAPTLYRQLMNALPYQGLIRFFGDNNQLPPVEEGIPPFINLLNSKPSIELTFNYRSNDEIVSNAMRILKGSMPQRNSRFEIIFAEEPIKELIHFVKSESLFTSYDNQVIVPTRKGKYGTMRINPSLQLLYNPKGDYLRLNRFEEKDAPLVVRAKDKFLWIKNDYQLNIFNGEIGTIDSIDTEFGSLVLATPDRIISVPPRLSTWNPYYQTNISYDPRKQIEHGYAITTHKAQGSEFDIIVYCVCGGMGSMMLNRRNFYTAVTRARDRVIMICDRRGMSFSLNKAKVKEK